MITLAGVTYYDLEEVRDKIGISIPVLRRWIKEGLLKGTKVGIKYYVTEQALLEIFERGTVSPEITEERRKKGTPSRTELLSEDCVNEDNED